MLDQKTFGVIKEKFNSYFDIKEKRPGLYQLYLPLYHADGDMLDIFLEEQENGTLRLSDRGLSLMRLSYDLDVNTENRIKILDRILSEHNILIEGDNIYVDTRPDSLYPALMQFSQTISKITNMKIYKREVIKSLFYEMLEEFITTELSRFNPQKQYYPLPGRDEYEVDYSFNDRGRPVYLFGVNNSSKARLATISCQKFIEEKLQFMSVIVYEDFEDIGKKDQARVMAAADKLFPNLESFRTKAAEFMERN